MQDKINNLDFNGLGNISLKDLLLLAESQKRQKSYIADKNLSEKIEFNKGVLAEYADILGDDRIISSVLDFLFIYDCAKDMGRDDVMDDINNRLQGMVRETSVRMRMVNPEKVKMAVSKETADKIAALGNTKGYRNVVDYYVDEGKITLNGCYTNLSDNVFTNWQAATFCVEVSKLMGWCNNSWTPGHGLIRRGYKRYQFRDCPRWSVFETIFAKNHLQNRYTDNKDKTGDFIRNIRQNWRR